VLNHGDKILFGNSNLFVLICPGQEITDEMRDFESIMAIMVQD